jgi:hypothetical protein
MCAEAASPKIAKLRATDPSITEYVVQTPDPDNQFHIFLEISELGGARLDKSNSAFLLSLFRELENLDQYWTLRDAFDGKFIISTDEPLPADLLNPESEQDMKNLASNLWKLTLRQLNQIPVTTLALVLSHESLQISSEDLLYRFISDQIPTNPDYFQLFRFLRFDCLSGASIADFIPLSINYFEHIDLNLWEVICQRLELPAGYNCENERAREVYRPLDERERPDGIISYLSHGWEDRAGRELLEIATGSVENDEDREIAAAIIAHGGVFASDDEPNQWIIWHFAFDCVRPTHYSFSSDAKSWILEGSMDAMNWTEIDWRTEVDWPKDSGVRSFAVSHSIDCRYARLTQTDTNRRGNDVLSLHSFEVFGSIWDADCAE